jgi:hypothetical protein
MLTPSRSQCPWNNYCEVSTRLEIRFNHHIPLVYPHVLRDKCLQMEDLLGTQLASMLVEGRPLDDLRLERIVRLRYQFPREGLYDRG